MTKKSKKEQANAELLAIEVACNNCIEQVAVVQEAKQIEAYRDGLHEEHLKLSVRRAELERCMLQVSEPCLDGARVLDRGQAGLQ